MTEFLAVTTFNAEGKEVYGDNLMMSFALRWPIEVPLWVYTEGFDLCPAPSIVGIDLLSASDWLGDFKHRHRNRNRKHRDYRHDAVRFAHKIAALLAADGATDARYLIWLDGDVYTHSRVSLEDLRALAPKRDQWASILWRRNLHPECGFMVFDREHPEHVTLMNTLRDLYAGDMLFHYREWHDSYLIQKVIEQAEVETFCLSGTQGRNTSHPLVNGPLGAWFDHLKGNRKKRGKSMAGDLRVQRDEPYWRGMSRHGPRRARVQAN